MNDRVKNYIQESHQELKRVNWPTKQETVRYTLFVILLSVGVAVFLGVTDFVFAQVLEKVIL